MVASAPLRSLSARPFELLLELERRCRDATAGRDAEARTGQEWVGVAFRLGVENFMVAREETREVISLPQGLTRVPGARDWIKGLINVRGQLMPVIDLRDFLGGGIVQQGRSARILIAQHREVPAGLLVDEVFGFRRFNESEFAVQIPATILRTERYLAGAFRRTTEVWPVFSLKSLLESNDFLMGAAT